MFVGFGHKRNMYPQYSGYVIKISKYTGCSLFMHGMMIKIMILLAIKVII